MEKKNVNLFLALILERVHHIFATKQLLIEKSFINNVTRQLACGAPSTKVRGDTFYCQGCMAKFLLIHNQQ